MKVYVDVIVFENFIIDLFLLRITCKVLKYKSGKKIYFAALIGGLYSLVVVIKSLNFLKFPNAFFVSNINCFFYVKDKYW